MEAQLHHTHGRHYDDPLHPAGADIHDDEEHGMQKESTVKKVRAKVEKLKATIKHGHGHHDEQHHNDHAQAVNDTPAVRSGLVEPTDLGQYPVLVEDLHTTHSDILDPPVRSFAQWEEEERQGVPPPLSTGIYGTDLSHVGHHGSGQDVNREHELRGGIGKSTGMVEDPSYTTHSDIVNPPVRSFAQWDERQDAPPPLSTGIYGTDLSQVGHHGSGDQDVNREQLRGSIGKSTGMVEDPSAPNPTTAVSPANYQTKVTDPTKTGGNEAGITEVLGSFDKMGVYDEPFTKSSETDENEPKVYTGSHDQFAPEPVVENTPSNTVAGDPSSHSSSYTEKITSATSAIGNKAAAAKDMIASKLGSSGENESESPKSSFHSTYAHKVADTMTGTLGPVYEKVVCAGSSVMSKIQGDKSESPKSKGVSVKEYLADSFRPGDEDKAMSETITHALHGGKGNQETTTTTTTTTIYVRDGGERRLQESDN